MKLRKTKQTIVYIMAVGIGIGLLFIFIACTWIGYEVKSQCQEAKREYGGDCGTALVSLLKDEKKSFRSRNEAIWALGQLGDSRALTDLEYFYTGVVPPREPLDEGISQYELKKAINLVSGGKNIPALVWRYGIKE